MLKISLPIDYFLSIGITSQFNLLTSMLSQQLSDRHNFPITIEIGECLSISGGDLLLLNLVLTDIQCSAIRFRNTLLDLSEQSGKPIMNLLVGISEFEIIHDESLMYILCFSLAQVAYFSKADISKVQSTLDSLFEQTVGYHVK
jgi:hypothetical protein